MANNNIPNDPINKNIFLGKQFGDDTSATPKRSFWNSFRRIIIRSIIGTLAAIILVYTFYFIKNYHTNSIQTAFLNAKSIEQLQAFANEYKKDPLGGVAFVQLADKNYSEGNFPLAASYYRDALPGLKDTELEGRARFGLAMSLLQNNDPEGQSLLTEISHSTKSSLTLRSQALYQLFIVAVQQKDFEQAKQLLATLRNQSENNPWADKANQLEAALAELQNPASAS
jgi:predicted negative regulator of RcsB-dependent stress response